MRSRASYKILRALTLNRSLPVAGGDLVGAEGKGQNHVEEYQTIIPEWHDGFAVDPVAVHLGKPAKKAFHLLIAWAKFLKEM